MCVCVAPIAGKSPGPRPKSPPVHVFKAGALGQLLQAMAGDIPKLGISRNAMDWFKGKNIHICYNKYIVIRNPIFNDFHGKIYSF